MTTISTAPERILCGLVKEVPRANDADGHAVRHTCKTDIFHSGTLHTCASCTFEWHAEDTRRRSMHDE